MNEYLKNLDRVEFVITLACTGRCKHCSEGDHKNAGEHIAPAVAADALKRIASLYPIKTVMTFGGEPLLYPEAVFAIQSAAYDIGAQKRQIITNGFFTKEDKRISEVAAMVKECGVNDVLLSVDAFHQETIPLEPVVRFARELLSLSVPVRTQPAWLVSSDDDNRYNIITRDILAKFACLGIEQNEGNVIFPAGNALRYLGEYFKDGNAPCDPYVEDPFDVRSLSFSENGDVLDGNVYKTDILEIISSYKPKE